MKIKKIAAQCKDRGKACLYDYTDSDGCISQWIGNGAAVWPVNGVPMLEAEHLPALFDLTGKQMEEMNILHAATPEDVSFRDYDGGDILATEARLRVIWNGCELMMLTAKGVTYYIDTELLAPIWAEYERDTIQYCLRRKKDGTPYFAVLGGLLLVGLVWPMVKMQTMAEEMAALAAGTPAE